jgi:hypothetical protein
MMQACELGNMAGCVNVSIMYRFVYTRLIILHYSSWSGGLLILLLKLVDVYVDAIVIVGVGG